jgi:hypothetical protein
VGILSTVRYQELGLHRPICAHCWLARQPHWQRKGMLDADQMISNTDVVLSISPASLFLCDSGPSRFHLVVLRGFSYNCSGRGGQPTSSKVHVDLSLILCWDVRERYR